MLEVLTSLNWKATYSKFDYCGLYHDLLCCCRTFSKNLSCSTSNEHACEAKHIGKTFWQTVRNVKLPAQLMLGVANDWNKHGRKSTTWNLYVKIGTRCDKRRTGQKGEVSTGAKHFWGLSYGKMIYRGVHPRNNQSRVVFNRRQSIFIDARSHNLNIRLSGWRID